MALCTRKLFWLSAVIALGIFSIPPAVSGQSESSIADLKNAYEDGIEELRVAIKSLKRSEAMFYHSESAIAHDHKAQWEADALVADTAFDKIKASSVDLFLATENPNLELQTIVAGLNRNLMEQGQLTTCYALTKKLLTLHPDDEQLQLLMGRASILTNDFETAKEFSKGKKGIIEKFPFPERAIYGFVDSAQTKFSRELKLRAAETKSDDLPRVELDTTKGKIVIELFENEAPETVGNFISLVESGFYDGVLFHVVISNIYARAGAIRMNRVPPVDYTIYDEQGKPESRHHFRGSVAMVLPGDKENMGSVEFRIMRFPSTHLDGGSTVFGRVISDLRPLDELQNTFKIDDEGQEVNIPDVFPDLIKSAKVLRKRDHDYQPNRVKK
jgi:cyclophilin family peptidyl-prolyl cis-trans isomerase